MSRRQSWRTAELLARLEVLDLWNVFNPSIVETVEGVAIAFRAGRWPGDRPFRAYYLPPGEETARPLDLTEAFAFYGITVVSDPKLLLLENEIWVTFNTGHFENPNRIFAARLHPAMSAPYELVIRGRQSIEKNWALFRRKSALHVVYSVSPLVVLKQQELTSDRQIVFGPLVSNEAAERSGVGVLTLGSQLAALEAKGAGFAAIVHRKFSWKGKRSYLGLAARIWLEDETYKITFDRNYLAHSIRSLRGDKIRHNPNLLSCTYFSGLIVTGEHAILSYGINDVTAGFADIPACSIGLGTQAINQCWNARRYLNKTVPDNSNRR